MFLEVNTNLMSSLMHSTLQKSEYVLNCACFKTMIHVCRWDWNAAGVGAALTEEAEQLQRAKEKEKEKEKKKRALQRKKEQKAKEEEEVSGWVVGV